MELAAMLAELTRVVALRVLVVMLVATKSVTENDPAVSPPEITASPPTNSLLEMAAPPRTVKAPPVPTPDASTLDWIAM